MKRQNSNRGYSNNNSNNTYGNNQHSYNHNQQQQYQDQQYQHMNTSPYGQQNQTYQQHYRGYDNNENSLTIPKALFTFLAQNNVDTILVLPYFSLFIKLMF